LQAISCGLGIRGSGANRVAMVDKDSGMYISPLDSFLIAIQNPSSVT